MTLTLKKLGSFFVKIISYGLFVTIPGLSYTGRHSNTKTWQDKDNLLDVSFEISHFAICC